MKSWTHGILATWLRKLLPARWLPIGYLMHLTRQRTGGRIAAGPFAGMRYAEQSVGSAYIPKLLGMYERELNECVEEACQKGPTLVVDLGAAEGYYAVGFALRLPNAKVVAYEMDPAGRSQLESMARLNGVLDRIEIRGRAEAIDLSATLQMNPDQAKTLVICDVEGYEQKLLDPEIVTSLRSTSILVELHDFIEPMIAETLIERFRLSHSINRIWQAERTSTEFPFKTLYTHLLPASYLDWTVSEWRPVRMSWLWMEPNGPRL